MAPYCIVNSDGQDRPNEIDLMNFLNLNHLKRMQTRIFSVIKSWTPLQTTMLEGHVKVVELLQKAELDMTGSSVPKLMAYSR